MAEDWKGSENQNGAVGPHYFVHYQGWKKTWDEWVPEERLLKHTEENVARQKALVDAQKAEAAAAAAVAAAHAAEQTNARSKKEESRKAAAAAAATATSASGSATGSSTNSSGATSGATSGSGRGSKRSRDASDADEHERRPEIHLTIPESLKAQLVDDWENVTRKEQLVPLPRKPNVKSVLREYADHYQKTHVQHTRTLTVLNEVLAGLKLYFDKSLAHNLLYRFEREQYVQMRKQHGPKMGDGDVQTDIAAVKPSTRRGRASSSSSTAAPSTPSTGASATHSEQATESRANDSSPSLGSHSELEASEIYGAEHLLRLFGM